MSPRESRKAPPRHRFLHQMYWNPTPVRPGGGGGGTQPSQQQQIHPNPDFFGNPYIYLQQSPGFFPHSNSFLHSTNNFPQFQQQFPNSNVPLQLISGNSNFQTSDYIGSGNSKFPQQPVNVLNDMIEKLDKAATSARRDLLASNEHVSAWKVSQAALLIVKAESWETLGFQMQRVPSLNRLLVTEGKINAFIHCFVAVRRMTSLYDLEVAICESEGIARFEELELGPLVRHPLAVHYFFVTPDVTQVHRITTEEIISYLCEFIHFHKKKKVKVDTFLDFISEKRSVCGREKLFVRIQNIRGYINHIEQVRQSEDRILEKCYEKMRKKSVTRTKKRPLFAEQKKELDDNFTTISQRVKSFSSASTEFCGTHIRFTSSSLEDDESEDGEYADNTDETNTDSHCSSSLPNLRSDHVSSCPYPSATEEIARLGLKIEVDSSACMPSGSGRGDTDNVLCQRKRRFENMSSRTSLPYKLAKKIKIDMKHKAGEAVRSLSTESLRVFITTWKETCRGNKADEVLERMLQFYKIRKKRKVQEFFTSYPFVGLLYAAVTCIKHEMWDNMYDTFQNLSETGLANKPCESSDDYLSIDVEPVQKDVAILESEILKHKYDVAAEEIMNKIRRYFEDDILNYKSLSLDNKIQFLRKFCMCESWLIEQYSVDKFESLGHGEYVIFLEKYMDLLPHPLQRWMMGDILENDSLEDCLLPIQLNVFLSQALNSLCENETIEMQNISELLAWQFPLVCLKLVNTNFMAKLQDIVRKKRCNVMSNCVLFSAPLLSLSCIHGSLTEKDKQKDKTTEMAYNTVAREGMTAAVTSKDAIEVLLKAPMLTDLNLWSHWDFLFAPSLGSFVEWLLREVNTKEFLCLVTKDGKVIRIDHSATLDSFVDVFLRESCFEIAVQLLSLFVLYGGKRNFPLSLLKCRARQAFEVIISNYSEVGLHDDKNPVMHGKPTHDLLIGGKTTSIDFGNKLHNKRFILNKASPFMSRLILDILSYLPLEFCSFAADILIAGLQPFVKDVSSAILTECKQIDQRNMLHEVGMSLGIVEWVHDYDSFLSSVTARSSVGASCLDVVNSELNTRSMLGKDELEKPSCYPGEVLVSYELDHHDHTGKRVGGGADSAEVSVEGQDANTKGLSRLDNPSECDSARVVESIRQDEFGLDQCHSATENKMLEKQHARLGRALHCLSQELYSQDSHFLLELVQNADDNMYDNNVDPTLVFILQEKSIVVLNNELGFLANNIRALCDVGNSTKCHGAGYIGKKGIGFKSVFRVTDAPEIHSNGFHIKFDITEGQIGFVLPTVVPPCDIDLYTSLASADADCTDHGSWNTCIILPFRSDFLEGFSMNNILSMFQDLHPSLLLFLHRLQCIKFRNILDNSLIVMRKKVMGDGIVEVSVGHEKMTWFVVSRKLKADAVRSDVQTTEISIAFTLREIDEGGYIPILDQQPVFAFLPLRTYGLKLILQGDFVLPSSREEVDGNSPWNQWLLLEFPDLFVAAERVFCDLSCYRVCPGKAVTVFMSFIPLVGEVHGFFSNLPRMIISKLRLSNCLILEGDGKEWVPPCKVLRNWTDQARFLLPDALLHEHLGLGFLDKDIVLSDSLAKALGVEDYGPKVLLRVLSSLCCSESGLRSMGLSWLTSFLSAMYMMSSNSFMQTFASYETESDCILNLRKIPFIPLSDGKYGSLDEDTIWLHCEAVGQGINDESLLKTFPKLYADLRIVTPDLLAAAAAIEFSSSQTIVQNVTRMLYKVGVQRLSAHDIMKTHILPAICDDKNAVGQEEMMIEYLAFAMFHLQSSCTTCTTERGSIVAELHEKALILTNYGHKRSTEVPIHFNQEYGNPVDVNKLISGLDMKWHEMDTAYLKHPITRSLSGGQLKWRIFLQEIGVTDFVQVVQVEKSVPGVPVTNCKDIVPTNCVTKNWESEELFHLISLVSASGDAEKSRQVLEILDRLWDDYFSNKVTGYCIDSAGECKPLKSSLLSILQDLPWMASNINNELHYPKYLFHDCLAVNSVLGVSAPYTNPKVRSEKLLADIGLKSHVTLDDALSVLNLWRRSESPFNASLSQMDNFYTFLWKEMTLSKKRIMEELNLGPYIFVPNTSSFSHEDAVPGTLLSPPEVYWHDNIGPVDQIKSIHPKRVTSVGSSSNHKMIYNLYPSLHDFFVNECGVDESPSLCSYLQILLQLSGCALPHQAAKKVFDVFLMWNDALRSGSLSFEDAECLKKSLQEKEYTVLPTKQDRWVSLHASFGLICRCDDDKLGSEFRYLKDVDFVNFGESTDEENQILQAKVSTIMQRLGIMTLSEIVTREAIYYGPADCSIIFSLVNWVLPYAQRYIYNANPDKYYNLKPSDFGNLRHLKIVVVEHLFYRNVIKGWEITSKKRHECDCLLQDNILYCSRESDTHSIFLELSRLLYNGSTDLQFANFLHMIVTMAKSGAGEEQTEFFILNSQKMRELPAEESRWFLEPSSSSMENNDFIALNSPPLKAEEHSSSVSKWKSSINSNWPPANWKTAPGFNSVGAFASRKPGSSSSCIIQGDYPEKNLEEANISQTGIIEFEIEVDAAAISQGAVLHEAVTSGSQSSNLPNLVASSTNTTVDFVGLDSRSLFPSNGSEREEAAQQALLTGRMGELVAFKYFTGKVGDVFVKWVNEANETGLPYDIVLDGGDENSREYVEVKATRSARKNWFHITMREWQFAIEKGESFSIAHVDLAYENMARVSIYKNPARLCQLGNLKLAIMIPK